MLAALLEMTGGTCAYCERELPEHGADAAVLTHHRPTWGAVGSRGGVDRDAYGWLAGVWTNLLPACADCVRLKGTRFPVRGPRATGPDELAEEEALLLDPVLDDPAEHLRFDTDGTVEAFTARGRASVDVLGLNRDALVTARAALVARLRAEPDADVGPAFAILRRQLTPADAPTGPALPPSASAGEAGGYDLAGDAPDGQDGHDSYFDAARWVERIVLHNFRPVRDLDLDLSRSTSVRGPWAVLLGENGSGKSSVLHALALTLMGGEQRRALALDAGDYLRLGARSGYVRVYLAGRRDPLELTFTRGDPVLHGPEAVPAPLLGYGAVRLLPRQPDGGGPVSVARVDNLLDPLRPLTDPETWLRSLPGPAFRLVATGIHALLALGPDDALERRGEAVRLRQGRNRSDLRQLSDGYQSMVLLACDILRSVLAVWERLELAEGIVLIDELGAHLHPRWRLRIVGALRELLPRMQFIVSTHDPLCLRGVLDGEVIVVRRNSQGDVVALSDLPPVAGMRVDQLLTSEHFGLGSTDEPEVAELWERYYRLKALRRPDAAHREELARVTARLDELSQLGVTERDRLVLDSATAYIAARRERGDEVARPPAEVTDRLARLWAEHLPGGSS